MIVDLNLTGKTTLVIGGGDESCRKIEALLSQQCEIIVVAEKAKQSIYDHAKNGKITLNIMKIQNLDFFNQYEQLDLILATTDNKDLNRAVALFAQKKYGCYVYAADDPQISDFSHPSVINIADTIQIGISTGGRSPIIGKALRKKIEPIIKNSIGDLIIHQIKLQASFRVKAKSTIPSIEYRKRFLINLYNDVKVNECLKENRLSEAMEVASDKLDAFVKSNSSNW